MKRRVFALILAVMVLLLATPSFAHKTPKHNEQIKKVLFGDSDCSSKQKLYLLQSAVYLCIDQANSENTEIEGETALERIKQEHIYGAPEDISEISFRVFGGEHREHTHLGWNKIEKKFSLFGKTEKNIVNAEKWEKLFQKENGWKEKWTKRQKLLLSTVNRIFSFSLGSGVLDSYTEKCNAFCELVYYIHIIGDHQDHVQKNLKQGNNYLLPVDIIPLIGVYDEFSTNVLTTLENCLNTLFENQTESGQYLTLKKGIQSVQTKAKGLISFGEAGAYIDEKNLNDYLSMLDLYFDMDGKIQSAGSNGEGLMTILENNVPDLLRHEEWFTNVFSGSLLNEKPKQ